MLTWLLLPTSAVLPSPEIATDRPNCSAASFCVSSCCCDQAPLDRVKTHAAPVKSLSASPPTIAVLPSEESATDRPCPEPPTAPVPRSLGPCSTSCACAEAITQANTTASFGIRPQT